MRSIDGKLEAQLSYINDVYDGTSYWFHSNGNLKREATYSIGKLNGWVREYYDTGLLKEEYFINNGIKDGSSREYYENGGLKKVLTYEKGILKNTEHVNYDKNFIAPPEAYANGNRQYDLQTKEDNILCAIDVCPVPIGGKKAIEENLIYPEHAKLYGLEGTVTLVVKVSKNGVVESTELLRGIGLGCDEAAQEAVMKTKFMPGQDKGEFVDSRITLNIPFVLEKKSQFALNYQKRKKTQPTQTKVVKETPKVPKVKETKVETEKAEESVTVTKKDKRNFNMLEYKIITGSYLNMECNTDECPKPKGGYEQILKNLVTPKSAFRKDIKGDVILIATIDKYGYVRDTKVIQGLGYGCDEAVEVAVLGTRFEPALDKGERTGADMIISVPIRK